MEMSFINQIIKKRREKMLKQYTQLVSAIHFDDFTEMYSQSNEWPDWFRKLLKDFKFVFEDNFLTFEQSGKMSTFLPDSVIVLNDEMNAISLYSKRAFDKKFMESSFGKKGTFMYSEFKIDDNVCFMHCDKIHTGRIHRIYADIDCTGVMTTKYAVKSNVNTHSIFEVKKCFFTKEELIQSLLNGSI